MSHRLEKNNEVESPDKEKKIDESGEKQSFKEKLSNFLESFKGNKEETKEKNADNKEKVENTETESNKTEYKKPAFLEQYKVNLTPEQIQKAALASFEKKATSGANADSGGRTPGEDAWDRLYNKHYLDLDEER